ncbi:MAG: imidazole glycerol phosphate synthase subunit HisH [Bacteroidetes bacterium]|jgi:glutamine amidotransferase|nr:imidazole glycerol phosphate synthase subunit HisH [Bacteroidota bacterium]
MLGIIDYGMGNLLSVKNAVEYLGHEVEIITSANEVENYDKLILPGVGAFPDCMNNLNKKGFVEILQNQVVDNKKPILGICLGMQVMATIGNELIKTSGLNWIDGEVELMQVTDKQYRIPHVGWAETFIKNHFIFDGIKSIPEFYFVHSYHMKCLNESNVIATINHQNNYTAAICKNNIIGCQFHPEKSQELGLLVLKNFITKNFNA